ncbi:hypothetical protein HK100_005798 [Physocladia obscura]|uniref:Uncharacterized protein n=1 Tax=Physocladia obscura TaxID=109957 RepID=A0AAD5X947_9FUNG|nr:hypothetical protein HK100_005798 [Physocladia obscura]
MVRVQNQASAGGGRSSVFFGAEDSSSNVGAGVGAVERPASRQSHASTTSSLGPSASISVVGQGTQQVTQPVTQGTQRERDQYAHAQPLPQQLSSPPPSASRFRERERERERDPPLPHASSFASKDKDTARLEASIRDLHDKMDEQTVLLNDLLQYIMRIDKDTGVLREDVAVLAERLNRL